MGDSVALHYEGGFTHFPFKVPSAVANIVAIWKTHEPKNAMKNSTGHANRDAGDDIMMEIRWFYRKNELPGSCRAVGVSDNTATHLEYEEIFETDHMQECHATSLLAPVKLHESAARTGSPEMKMQQGMPVPDAHCCRFWSIHRKALLPCGGLAGIVERGKMHSRHLGRSGVLNAALRELEGGLQSQQLEPEQKDDIHNSKNWKRAFSDTIEKLGLSDASEDTSVRGIPLTGREREQEEITTFLRSRICGDLSGDDDGDNAKNFSLFVAGPPGTGKTASVLSVIARLRLEQAKGKLPAFEFVSLNGMEMRHPFEAYVKFWEVMSGPEKQRKPPDIAAQLLERHFAGLRRDDDQATRPAVVLLLDEIDYLMTKKQSVLYNFFDWPVRSCENENGARLIVVGISNTLNLPSRLKPSVQSRLGGKMCQFRAYNVKDMMAILKSKIQSNKMVKLGSK
jgi:origin recognition complex subunit 1